jgi:hypothetical protein
MGASH